jgi:hypothetical protein
VTFNTLDTPFPISLSIPDLAFLIEPLSRMPRNYQEICRQNNTLNRSVNKQNI